MKKLLLSALALCLAVTVSAQQTPEEKATQVVNMENKRVGETLTEAQKKTIYDAYFVEFSKETPNMAEALKVVRVTLTPEQKEVRQAYFEARKK